MDIKQLTLAALSASMVALAGAGVASAQSGTTTFDEALEISDGGVTISYEVEALQPSSAKLSNVSVQGTLWEAELEAEAVSGSVTPIIPFFNARAATGENYRVLYQAIGGEAISGATLAPGQEAEGRIYFDVTGPAPTRVVYNDGVSDRLTWQD